MEIISEEGYRLDGRRPGEIRDVRIQEERIENKVSLFFEQGGTKIHTMISSGKEKSNQKSRFTIKLDLYALFSKLVENSLIEFK